MTCLGGKRISTRTIRHSPSFLAAAVLLLFGVDAEARAPTAAHEQQLPIGVTVEKTLPVGSLHAYRLRLAAGQHLSVELNEAWEDTYLRVYDPGGVQIADGSVLPQ